MWLFALLAIADAETLDRVLGWAADGSFAWEVTDSASWDAPDTGEGGAGSYKVRLGVVRAPDGETKRYVIEKTTT